MDQEGVRLMTLHAAKGLEFDAVWLIEAMEGQIPYKRQRRIRRQRKREGCSMWE